MSALHIALENLPSAMAASKTQGTGAMPQFKFGTSAARRSFADLEATLADVVFGNADWLDSLSGA
jgi:hypothetical protein